MSTAVQGTTTLEPKPKKKRLQADNKTGVGGARALGDALKTNTTLTQLNLACEQPDHKETQQESKASTMARGLFGQSTRLA